jgi:phosphoglycerate dehydrogenase-like enzyme
VDTEALVEALQSEKIYSAGLDVTDPEPLNADSPLWDMPNVIITPHSSGFSFNAAERRFNCFVEQLRRYIAGEELEYKVDFMVGY